MPPDTPSATFRPVEPGPPAVPPAPGRRPPLDGTGAVWLTGTGGMLLFAAAATFVAVRWHELEAWQKAAALVAVTVVILAGGWLGRRRLPTTSAALLTLGAVLVPLDGWTISAAGSGSWQRGLLVGGLLAVAWFPLARRTVDNVVLRAAWLAAVPLAVAGQAATTHGLLPPGLLLAAVGLAAVSAGRPADGRWWVAIGALAPVAALLDPVLPIGHGTLVDLGLRSPSGGWVAVATAAVVAVASGVEARSRGEVGVIVRGLAVAALDLMTALALAHAGAAAWILTAAVAMVLAEVAVRAAERDPLWARVGERIVAVPQLASFVGLASLACQSVRVLDRAELTTLSAASLLFAIGWTLADDRQATGRPGGWRAVLTGSSSRLAAAMVLADGVAAILFVPTALVFRAIGMVIVGAAALLWRRTGSTIVGPLVIGAGILVTDASTWSSATRVVVTTGAATVLVLSARRERSIAPAVWASFVATSTVVVTGLVGMVSAQFDLDDGHWVDPSVTRPWSLWILTACLVVGTLSSRRDRAPWPSIAPWTVAAGVVVGAGASWTPTTAVVVSAGAVAWWSVDAWARRHVLPSIFAVATSPVVPSALLLALGIDRPGLGVGLAAAAVATAGVAVAVPSRLRRPLLTSAGLQLVAGLAGAGASLAVLGVVTVGAGVLLVTVGWLESVPELAWVGALLALVGSWDALGGAHVDVAEAYLAPLALLVSVAGSVARRRHGISSWMADLPAALVLGGGALAVRVAGGSGWHAVGAGAVAVATVAVGSWRRLAGPLVGGSVLLAAVTANETLRVTAGAPTWAWLALGGTVLVGAGVTMELRGLGPVESGRRLVELVQERYR